MSDTKREVHPAAEHWPMLPESDLRRMAEDIAEHGLMSPIVLDTEGRVLDGRNRLAACRIAGVEPDFVTYEGDPVACVVSANNERRHMTLPERAASTALTLAMNGHREGGRWTYGIVSETAPENRGSTKSRWSDVMSHAGLVYDYIPEMLPDVAAGTQSLDGAVQAAKAVRRQEEQRDSLPDDLGALVDSGELSLEDALRRDALPAEYQDRVAQESVSLDEAETLAAQDEHEYRKRINRTKEWIELFLAGWEAASNLRRSPDRDAVLNALADHDRERFLGIEAKLPEV